MKYRHCSAVYAGDEKPLTAEAQRNDSKISLCVLCASAAKKEFFVL
jgi:hypothetical protein